MIHDAHGWWIREAGGVPPAQPALAEALRADVVVIGGGYTGMWTAWEVLEREPNARVVLLEADRCGIGPSGRNGGFLSSLWLYRANMEQQYGERRARDDEDAKRREADEAGEGHPLGEGSGGADRGAGALRRQGCVSAENHRGGQNGDPSGGLDVLHDTSP